MSRELELLGMQPCRFERNGYNISSGLGVQLKRLMLGSTDPLTTSGTALLRPGTNMLSWLHVTHTLLLIYKPALTLASMSGSLTRSLSQYDTLTCSIACKPQKLA